MGMREQDLGVKWFNTDFYPKSRTSRAVHLEDGVLPRLREDAITLFTPWGPRYGYEARGIQIREGDKEHQVLLFLQQLLRQWREKMPDKAFRWVFLAADLYGTRINSLPREVVGGYFESLAEWLRTLLPSAEFQLWSELDATAEPYRQAVRENFRTLVPDKLLARAEATAKAMGRGSSATEYLVERLAEAAFIEETLQPIKISCVGRHKDDGVDGNLPRLYFVPESLHAPWF
jgi:hypothetical protein